MSTTENKDETAEVSGSGFSSIFKDMLVQIGGSLFTNVLEQVQEAIKERVDEFAQNTRQVLTVAFLVVVGMIFLFVGAAHIIDTVMGIKGVGFVFVGIALALVGFLVNIFGRKAN